MLMYKSNDGTMGGSRVFKKKGDGCMSVCLSVSNIISDHIIILSGKKRGHRRPIFILKKRKRQRKKNPSTYRELIEKGEEN